MLNYTHAIFFSLMVPAGLIHLKALDFSSSSAKVWIIMEFNTIITESLI